MKFKLKIGLIGVSVIGIVLILIGGWLTGYLQELLFPHPFPIKEQIIIFTNKTEYKQGEVVNITVKNNLNRSIWYNKETCPPFCVQLQKVENSEWINVDMAIRVVSDLPVKASLLQPTEKIVREWDMFIFKPVDQIIRAESGKYRFYFNYGLSKDNFNEKTIYSHKFTIRAKGAACLGLNEEQCRNQSFCIPLGFSRIAYLGTGVGEEETFKFEECEERVPEYGSCREVVRMTQMRGGSKFPKECRCCCGEGPSCKERLYPEK